MLLFRRSAALVLAFLAAVDNVGAALNMTRAEYVCSGLGKLDLYQYMYFFYMCATCVWCMLSGRAVGVSMQVCSATCLPSSEFECAVIDPSFFPPFPLCLPPSFYFPYFDAATSNVTELLKGKTLRIALYSGELAVCDTTHVEGVRSTSDITFPHINKSPPQ